MLLDLQERQFVYRTSADESGKPEAQERAHVLNTAAYGRPENAFGWPDSPSGSSDHASRPSLSLFSTNVASGLSIGSKPTLRKHQNPEDAASI